MCAAHTGAATLPFNARCCLLTQDVSPDIRQSAFALVGDLARVACPYLSPALTQVRAPLPDPALGPPSVCLRVVMTVPMLFQSPTFEAYRHCHLTQVD